MFTTFQTKLFSLILTLIIDLLYFITIRSLEKSVSLEKPRNELIEKQEELYQMIILANAASKAKDYDKFGMGIHSLKGLAGDISANKLYRCLMIMDKVVVKGDYD